MEKPQFPQDAEDAKGTPAPRSSLRLSDAEAVATTRLDMFGDGSLRTALSGAEPRPQGGHGARATATAANPPLAAGADPDRDQPALPAAPSTEAHLPLPTIRHRLGAVSDPPPGEHTPLESEWPEAPPAPPPDLPQALDHADPDAPPAPQPQSPSPEPTPDLHLPPAAAAPPMEASPILGALDAAEKRSEELAPRELAAPPPLFSPVMLMPPGLPEQDGAADAIPLSERPRFREALVRGPAGSGTASDAESQATAPAMLMPPGSPEQDGSADAVPLSEQPQFRDELIRAPAGSRVAIDAEPQAAAVDPEAASYPGYPEVPPYLRLAEAPTRPAPPSYPPYRELPAAAEPVEPQPPLFDASAKIAAEANATAEALENLRRLLGHKLPALDREEPAVRADHWAERMVRPPPTHDPPPLQMRFDPAQFATYAPAPFLPLPVPPARSSSKSIYLLGFLTGLVLSLMAGAALYFFIDTNAG